MATQETTRLYRVENPNIPATPDGANSHDALVGQWFTPDLRSALAYLRKATQKSTRDKGPVDGTRLVVADIPTDSAPDYLASRHPIAGGMEIEPDNYIIPRDGSVETTVVPLDEILGDLRGQFANPAKFLRSKTASLGAFGSVCYRS